MGNLVSIITPTYNSERYVEETINSILNQTYPDWNLLITDDKSTDGTWEILKHYSRMDKRIQIFQLDRNSGPGIARNNSIKKAKGRFIAFCDSDDLWLPNKLETQIRFMEENQVYFSYGPYEVRNNQGTKGVFYPPNRLNYKDLLKTCSIGCLTAVYDSDFLGKMYMPAIRKRQDYGLWLKILKNIDYAESYGHLEAIYRVQDHSVSSNKIKAAQYQWKIYRKIEKIDILRSLYYLFHYAINGILKPN
jgi:teichuronic acid biosynthesis glycosyltransferase TuaG